MAISHDRYILARDLPDPRDYLYGVEGHHLRKAIPKRVDLRSHCPKVQNQGRLGTCTAHAVAAAFRYEQKVQKLRVIRPSRLFIYYNERKIGKQRKLKHVVRLRDALKSVSKHGVCPESLWEYNDDSRTFWIKPPKEAYNAATLRRVFEYHRIPNEEAKPATFLRLLKRCLADRCPVLFGFSVYESFETGSVMRTGVMVRPNTRKEKFHGGHAVMAVGYDDNKRAVLVRNSWGGEWGTGGHFWMPYSIITDTKITHDFWTVRGVTG